MIFLYIPIYREKSVTVLQTTFSDGFTPAKLVTGKSVTRK